MEEIINALQKEIYRIDWQIGVAADNIRTGNVNNTEWYDIMVLKRGRLINCLNELKEINK